MNLLDNATKFSRHNATPEISIGTKTAAGETVLWVKDNGIGLDAKDFEKIFGLFERLHSTQEYEGTGVGIAIVKLIWRSMVVAYGPTRLPAKAACFTWHFRIERPNAHPRH